MNNQGHMLCLFPAKAKYGRYLHFCPSPTLIKTDRRLHRCSLFLKICKVVYAYNETKAHDVTICRNLSHEHQSTHVRCYATAC
jgi:hypothetical protein